MRRTLLACVCHLLLIYPACSGKAAEESPVLPRAVGEEHFAALKKHSPFLRMLSLEGTYALRGIATIGNDTFITLQHRKTKKTITVNSDKENEQGMRLLTVSGSNPENVAVKIIYGGSEFEFAYEQAIIQPKNVSPPGTRDTIRRDREGRVVTTDQLVKKWQSLSDEQRRAYDRWKEQLLRARPDLRYSEKRFPIAHKALDAFKAGRTPPPIR